MSKYVHSSFLLCSAPLMDPSFLQLASRTTRDYVQPTFLFHLVTEKNGGATNRFGKPLPILMPCSLAVRSTQSLQTDYTNLKRMQTELETALDELKTAYARRIARNL